MKKKQAGKGKEMKGKKAVCEKYIFGAIVVASFLMIYVYNVLTPLMSDDLLFDKSLYHSFLDVIKQEYFQYMNWNGRSVLQIILKIFSIFPKSVFDVFNSICYVATMLLVYLNVKREKVYDVFLYVLINICVWVFCVDFSQTILWLAGACNYLWGICIILSFVTIYRFYLQKGSEIKHKRLAGILLFVTGMLAGWGNENTSGGAILIILLLTAKYYYENKKVTKVMVSGIAGSMIGFLFLLMAPGNKVRSAIVTAAEEHSGIAAYISRGLKVLKAMDEHLLVYVVVICLLGAYFYYSKKYKLMEFAEVAIFAFASVATAAVLIMTAEPMARAYFGANIYMMIAALKMVQMIREEDTILISLKTGGIIAAAIALCFMYVEEGANLVRIRREINIRENYILEERAKGESDMTLPMLRPEFATKYSMVHLVDISDDETNWHNNLYKDAYGIDQLKVLPWDEWEDGLE